MTNEPEISPVKAAIYCRISKDRAGAGLGVDRQKNDCRTLAKRLGWHVAEVFIDNDVSAYSGKRRPEYEALMTAVERGEIDAILAWHPDRLHRRAGELESFITIVERRGTQIQTVKAGSVDLTTPSGRMVARMLGAAAQHEVEQTRERIRAKKAELAGAGKYRGGPRPYGYEADGVTIRTDEAKIVRRMTKQVIAGRSTMALAKELNDAGLVTSVGRPWTYQRLRDVLVRPRNAGLIHRGRADRLSDDFEITGKSVWPPLVDEDEWRAVRTILMDPARKKGDASREARWLGSGIYICGRCHAPMRHTSKVSEAGGNRLYYYRCAESNHLAIASQQTDKHVRDVVAAYVTDPRVAEAMAPNDSTIVADRERRATLVARLGQAERDYDDGLIDGRRLKATTVKINAEIAEIDERMASGMRRSQTAKILSDDRPAQAFRSAPIDVQKAAVRALVRVTIEPVARRGEKWSPERIKITPAV